MNNKDYEVIPFPKSRIGTIDVGIIGNKKHHVVSLIEFDVSDARKAIKTERKNKKISFTAWMLKTISETLMNHKEVCGYLGKKHTKIVFDNISITIAVEKNINGTNVPIPLLIENINKKSIEEITEIIENAKESEIKNESDTVINNKYSEFMMRLYYLLPKLIRVYLLEKIINNPFKSKKAMGNVMYTTVGNAGVHGWIIPKSYHNLCFAVGSVVKKPWVVKDKIEIREICQMTILLNHDVVDGRPMAKFVTELIKNIEKVSQI